MKQHIKWLIIGILGTVFLFMTGWFVTGTTNTMKWDEIGKVMFCLGSGLLLLLPQIVIGMNDDF